MLMISLDYNIYMDMRTNIIILPALVSHNVWEMHFKVQVAGSLEDISNVGTKGKCQWVPPHKLCMHKKFLELNAQMTGMPVQN